jgi:UDP-glucose 4-epimerase
MSFDRDSSLRILVTGAAGFIGSHTVDLLLDIGHDVVGIDDLSRGHRVNVKAARHRGFRLVDDDLLCSGVLADVITSFQPDAVIHLAGLTGIAEAEKWPHRNRRLNVDATRLLAEVAAGRGVRRIVFGSSAAVSGEPEPKGELGRAKLESERILEEFAGNNGMICVSTRMSNVYGSRQDPEAPQAGVVTIFADRCKRRLPITIFGDGTQTRDFLAVQDAARGLMLAATRPEVPSGALDLCSGTTHTVLEVSKLVRSHFPKGPKPVFAPARPADITHSTVDPSRALEQLGFSASISLEEGLRGLIDPGVGALRRAA